MAAKPTAKESGSEEPAKESASAAREPKPKFDWSSLNTLAVVSLASAVSGIGALIAIITGHISMAQIKTTGENGRTMALVGTVIGYLSIFGWLLFAVIGTLVSARYGFEGGHLMQQPRGFFMDMDKD